MKKNDILFRIFIVLIMGYIYLKLPSITTSDITNILFKIGFICTILIIILAILHNMLFYMKKNSIYIFCLIISYFYLFSYIHSNGIIEYNFKIFIINLIIAIKNIDLFLSFCVFDILNFKLSREEKKVKKSNENVVIVP